MKYTKLALILLFKLFRYAISSMQNASGYIGHICRMENSTFTFTRSFCSQHQTRDITEGPFDQNHEGVPMDQARKLMKSKHEFSKLVWQQTNLSQQL